MNNDRELLELAAEAAGKPITYSGGVWFFGSQAGWNPLTDDGDALRLAVKLGIFVKIFPAVDDEDHHYPSFVEAWQIDAEDPLWVEYEVGNDPYTATRRAIVRTAAEIGKEMK